MGCDRSRLGLLPEELEAPTDVMVDRECSAEVVKEELDSANANLTLFKSSDTFSKTHLSSTPQSRSRTLNISTNRWIGHVLGRILLMISDGGSRLLDLGLLGVRGYAAWG